MKKAFRIASLLVFSSLLFGCADKVVAVDIVLNETQKTMAVGEEYQIQASFVSGSATFVYSSLNEDVATVSDTGLVKAVGVGETIIMVTYKTYKSLLKIIVEDNQTSSTLGFNIQDKLVSLYKDDQYQVKYESRLNGEIINLTPTYSGYDTALISFENDTITALNVGSTDVKASVTYGGLYTEELFTVSILPIAYNLVCNYEDSQVIVDEEDLRITYSLTYGSTVIRNLALSDLECNIPESDVAKLSGDYITGLKKGTFELEVSYLVPETNETISSSNLFRSRERYTVKSTDFDGSISVLDGDYIQYKPTSSDINLTFDSWLKNGVEFNEPVESDLQLGVKWRVNEFNFARDVRGAKSVAPSEGEEGETLAATYYNDNDVYANGLQYQLSKTVENEATLDNVANIYLPKVDYRKVSKITYYWKTNGYVHIDTDHWYAGALALGGTIEITYNGSFITQKITQTYDVGTEYDGQPYSFKGVSRTLTCDDEEVIKGNDNLKSLYYWAYKSITTPSYIYISNPNVDLSHEYLPYIRLGNYTGTKFYTEDPHAHYASKNQEPSIIQNISSDNDSSKDYLYYTQDMIYDPEVGHQRANFTLSLPAIDFAKYNTTIIIPFTVEGGFYFGFAEDKCVGDFDTVKGYVTFSYIENSKLIVSLIGEERQLLFVNEVTDNDVIHGVNGFTFPVCHADFSWQRGVMFYQPKKCVDHQWVNTLNTEKIGQFGTVCAICGATGELSEDLMHFSDIDFTVAQYDAQGGKWGTNVQPTTKTLTYEVTAGNVENEIKLPKINFSLYKKVKFKLTGNDWDARVGLESGSYAFPYAYKATPYSGTLTFIINDGSVDTSLSCPEGTTQNLVITDSNIISGNKALSLFMIADNAYRTITAQLIDLSSDDCSHNFIASSEKIGVEVCSMCGEERNYKNSLNEIDFTVAQYGAQGGKWGTNVQPTTKTLTYEALKASEGVISLPKINFNSFDSVKFKVSCGSFAIGTGLISGEYVLPGSNNNTDPAHTGVLTLTLLNSNQLEVNLVCNENHQSQTVIIEDQDVINGDKSVNMYMYCEGYEWQNIIIELSALN